MAKFSLRLHNVAVHIIGSVHSTSSCVERVSSLAPSHLFVEATRDTIGLIKRNPRHSEALLDLPSLVSYSEQHRIPLHAMDTTAADLTHRLFSDLSPREKLALWRYVMGRKLLSPAANLVFVSTLSTPSSMTDAFIERWAIAPSALAEARSIISKGGSEEDVGRLLESSDDISSFRRSKSDPLSYTEMCDRFLIDNRLQSVIIDYRNDFMCHQVRRVVKTIPPESVCAIVVGKNHVDGMFANLSRGIEYSPESLKSGSGKASFMDQLLLAQLLRT